ncbi:PTS sugar transporter subunit IIB [Bacillus nitroreducens]
MKTIMLVCVAGMSTSLLVSKMQKAAEEQGIEANIFARSAQEIEFALEQNAVDVLLLGPQVRYMKKQIEEEIKGKDIPIADINMQDYGMMNGQKVLEHALKIIDSK